MRNAKTIQLKSQSELLYSVMCASRLVNAGLTAGAQAGPGGRPALTLRWALRDRPTNAPAAPRCPLGAALAHSQERECPSLQRGRGRRGGEDTQGPGHPHRRDPDSPWPHGLRRHNRKETRTLNGRHHRPFEVGVDVYVLGLLRGPGRRGHHHPRGLDLGRHVHPLRRGGVVRGLQGEQGLQGLLLEQASDWLLLRRRGRRRLRLRRWDQPRRVRLKPQKGQLQSLRSEQSKTADTVTGLHGPS